MSFQYSLPSFADEMVKIAIKIRGIHGTHGRWDVLRPNVGRTIGPQDPNPKSLYIATKARRLMGHVSTLAHRAVRSRGGEAVIGHVRVDTKKGWQPHTLTSEGRKHFKSVGDAKDFIEDMDHTADKKARGAMWRVLNKSVGAWYHPSHRQTTKPTKWRPAKAGHLVMQEAMKGSKVRGGSGARTL